MNKAFERSDQGITVKIKVVPGSDDFKVIGFDNFLKAFIIKIKSNAEENKANLELIKELSRQLNCNVRITKGMKSKLKILILSNCEKEKAESFFKP